MADRGSTPPIVRKPSATSHGAGQNGGVACGTRRITDAQCLSLAQQLVILDESTELPPFGMCMSGLQQRLKRRLGLDIAESAIKACLSPYYDLAEWEDRYITKSLGVEVQEFGSADHPPRSPLKEFSLSSDGEYDGSDDDDGGGGGGGGEEGYDDGDDMVPAGGDGANSLDGGAVGPDGTGGGGNGDSGGAGKDEDIMQEGEEDEDEEEEEEEDAATGAGAAGGEEFGAGSVGGGRARSGGGAGGGAAAAPIPVPTKAADAAGIKASPHLARSAGQPQSAPSSSAGEVFQGTERHSRGAAGGSNPRGAGGGGAVEIDGMEIE